MQWPTREEPPPKDPVELTPELYQQLLVWVRKGTAPLFYKRGVWVRERAFVIQQDKNECWICKHKYHRHRSASLVHHIRHLTARPELALSMWVFENGLWRRQLVALCDECHWEMHPERVRNSAKRERYSNTERWD